jgi:crotonobetainyl-CoA:carnitine CoA-transferase CaiB-like acyl-CoA transferase
MIGLVEGASPAQPSDAEGATSSLSSILVADLSRVLAGPLIGMTLGDLGAEVIKVEHPRGAGAERPARTGADGLQTGLGYDVAAQGA